MPDPQIAREEPSIQDMLDQRPARWLRTGMWWLFFLLAACVLLSLLIRLPRLERIPVMVYTTAPPLAIRSPAAGYVRQVLVQPPERVKAGQELVLLDYTMAPDQLDRLEAELMQLSQKEKTDLTELPLDKLPPDLLPAAHRLREQIAAYLRIQADEEGQLDLAALQAESAGLRQQLRSRQDQRQALEEELAIARKRLRNLEQLQERGAVSDLDVDAARLSYLQYQRQLQVLEDDLAGLELKGSLLQNRSAKLATAKAIRSREARQDVMRRASLLLAQLRRWKADHLITSPSDGWLEAASQAPSPGGYLPAESVLYKLHSRGDSAYAEGLLPQKALQDVVRGRPATIRLEAFPHRTYGELRGYVSWIAPDATPLPESQGLGYRLRIRLPEGLKTGGKKPIPPGQGMLAGQARLELGRQRLWERLFPPL